MKAKRISIATRGLYFLGLFSLLLALGIDLAAEEIGREAPDRMPPGSLTAGALHTKDYWEGIGDVVVPLHYDGAGLLFLNPRASLTDNDAIINLIDSDLTENTGVFNAQLTLATDGGETDINIVNTQH